ncbi:uncharacterized protein LOC127871517 isoform X7 [Dreissena polymorpha]|uniref:uncharacterized protein LOC127871517 isoform X7 n=1 Tax=Dreissena polymorpha TaxID=45954 RepID=UPI002264675B|nr:uncharacterized protein LOC127871517 isoform X7 [Dreissena polymorpha]
MVSIIGFVLLILGVYGDELLPLNNVTLRSGGTVYDSWDPHRVIDGNTSTDADTCKCCTAISRPAWISLNIGQPYLVTKIEIYGRTDHDIDQSQNMRLCVGLLDEIEEGCRDITNSDPAIVFNPPRLAQFVNFTGLNNGTWAGKVMTICEIKIFQQNAINIALSDGYHRILSQAKAYNTCTAEKAVDGKYSSTYASDTDLCNNCSATDGSVNPFWQIDFGTPVFAQYINIIGRIDVRSGPGDQSENLLVYTSNDSMTTNNDRLVINITSANIDLSRLYELRNESFQYLTIQRFSHAVMTLCEVRIYRKVCNNGTFGERCQPCGHCQTGTTCNQNGHCTSGCEPGWEPDLCNKECLNGTYGTPCQTCGHCQGGTPCNKITGNCQSGCEPGWNSSKCDKECADGTYGVSCRGKCGHCKANLTCNKTTGVCPTGCEPGWQLNTCDTECADGTYGVSCQAKCGHCKANLNCNKTTGVCPTGCEPGWQLNTCDTACSGHFGNNCSNACHCNDTSEQCNTIFGICTSGCSDGWGGDNCSIDKNIILSGNYSVTATQSSTYVNCSASRAIDGKLWNSNPTDCSKCSATDGSDQPWLQIDLKRQILGSSLRLFGRVDNPDQSNAVYVYVRNETLGGDNNTFIEIINNASSENGVLLHLNKKVFRYLILRKWTQSYMAICEVKIYQAECPPGHFGDMCALECHCAGGKACDSITGQCQNQGCTDGWQGVACNQSCTHQQYGQNCSSTCHCYGDTDCDKFIGTCPGMCENGWTGNTCSTVCPWRRFGDNCSQTCHCVDQHDCNKTDGTCPGLCEIGWDGTSCAEECHFQRFGQNCNRTCHCRGSEDCTKAEGQCPGICDVGWAGSQCSEPCDIGWFGSNCSSQCHCQDDTTCNHVNGSCQNNQCAAGWTGDNCSSACKYGFYGINCSSECHCQHKEPCHHIFGNCSNNLCAPGWISDNCSIACGYGYFGLNCSSPCHCQELTSCDHVSGHCSDNDCSPGWTGNNCYTGCPVGFYGLKCAAKCHCQHGSLCDHVYGNCSDNQCDAGWTMDNCSKECKHGYFGKKCESQCRCNENALCNNTNGHCSDNLCADGWRNENCSIACAPGYYGENCSMDCHCEQCHNVNGSCALYSKQCRGGFRLEGEFCTHEDSKPTSVGAIGGSVGAAIAVIIGIAVGLWFFRRRVTSKNKHRSSDSTELTEISKVQRPANAHENAVYADTEANSKVYANTDSDYYSYNDVVPGINIHLLWDYIREKTKPESTFFEEEFAKLPSGLIHKHDLAAAVENRGKTRYREMFAYDHSRVPLEKEKPNDSEYINASFIHGFGKVTKFIASQGPTDKMIEDFWRMIWQQRVDKIAMLTNVIEMGTLKCLQYWPEEMNGVCSYGGVEIKYAAIEETFDYNIRSFDIRRGKESRRVKQFHFKTWPDKDVPETTWSLVDFWRAVDTSDAANISPIVVHCSAGVGRTGTFIALDILITQARMEGSIRPLQMVEALRQQRVNMVQTKEQYKYLHEAVAEALLIGTHPVLTRQFASVVDYIMGKERKSRTTRLEEQFNLIVKSVQEVPESAEEQSSGPTYGNMETVMSELHAYRPQLQKRGSKFIQRLGAIFLPTVGNTNALLVCMSPTDQHMEEFWSLVDEHRVTTVISLASPGSATYETCQYLGARGSGRVGQFSVNYIHEKKNKGSVERTFSFRDENHEDEDYLTTIKQFQLTSWLEGHDTPSDIQSFLGLIEEVLKWQPSLSDKRPILIHCQTGFMRCGLTALVLNEIQRIRKENGQINIVESFKTMKTRCQDLVHNKTQYRFCYEAILAYITNSGTYQNL